jgi:hypothetical protein
MTAFACTCVRPSGRNDLDALGVGALIIIIGSDRGLL